MDNVILKDVRSNAFKTCIRFINYELVEGDICEFGVYSGRSLALLSHHNNEYVVNENDVNNKDVPKRISYGFDSWDGLPNDDETHPRWTHGLFKLNHSYHPIIPLNKHIEPIDVYNFFKVYNLDKPVLVQGEYIDLVLPNELTHIALVHIDCDLYNSTKQILNLIESRIVDGTILLFDDWFNYKGNPNKGEQRAFNEFLNENPRIKVSEYLQYATFCKAFIIHL